MIHYTLVYDFPSHLSPFRTSMYALFRTPSTLHRSPVKISCFIHGLRSIDDLVLGILGKVANLDTSLNLDMYNGEIYRTKQVSLFTLFSCISLCLFGDIYDLLQFFKRFLWSKGFRCKCLPIFVLQTQTRNVFFPASALLVGRQMICLSLCGVNIYLDLYSYFDLQIFFAGFFLLTKTKKENSPVSPRYSFACWETNDLSQPLLCEAAGRSNQLLSANKLRW